MTIPATMSGVQLTGHGGPEKLVWNDAIPVPRLGPGQVLVKVAAAGVNNTDINTRIGWYSSTVTTGTDEVEDAAEDGGWSGALDFPRIQGGDLCGHVVAAGEGTGLATGARVTSQINIPRPTADEPTAFIALGSEVDGAFAEYCLCEAGELFDVSASPLSDVEIAAMPCGHGTAWNLLSRSGVGPGDRVLVAGASGGVGLAAVQLAAHLGAEVVGQTAPEKAEAVLAAGAAETLGRSDTPPAGSFDAVVDVVGGSGWQERILALKAGGRCATSGAIAGPVVTTDLRDIYLRDITIHGCSFMARETFAGLVALINEGAVRPLVSKTYPLRDIAVAQADFSSKRYPGKLVLVP